MRVSPIIWSVAALATVVASCAPAAIHAAGGPTQVQQGATIDAGIAVADRGFTTKAALKSVADVQYYVFQLVSVAQPTLPLATNVVTVSAASASCHFTTVPNGTYQLRADVQDAGHNSISVSGPSLSTVTATVTSPNVTYSNVSGPLSTSLQLLNGTGETIASGASVVNGNPYTGSVTAGP